MLSLAAASSFVGSSKTRSFDLQVQRGTTIRVGLAWLCAPMLTITIWRARAQVYAALCNLAHAGPATTTRLGMLSRPLELNRVPAALGVEGDGTAVGTVQLGPRLHPVDANALPSERLPGCG